MSSRAVLIMLLPVRSVASSTKLSLSTFRLPDLDALKIFLLEQSHVDTHALYILVVRDPRINATTRFATAKVLDLVVALVCILGINGVLNGHFLGIVVAP